MISDSKNVPDLKKIVNTAGELLLKKKKTVAVAESVTSGNIQAIFSMAQNTIRFFQGGITAYNLGQKSRHLHVEPTDAIEYNCVSKKVAQQMAIGVSELFSADYGIGITGYASPVPEQNVGKLFAFICIAKNKKPLLTKKVAAKPMAPEDVQLFYTEESLKLLISALKS
jgi:nicotinamide-nucleotide amidase